MTLPLDDGRPDPRSLPLFESRTRRSNQADGTPRRPPRPRPASGLHAVDAVGDSPGDLTPRRTTSSEVDWEVVAAFRSQASDLLTKRLGMTGCTWTGPRRRR